MKEIFDLLPSFSGGGKGDIRPNPLRQTDAEYARLSTTLCACGGRLGNTRGWVGSPTWRAKWIGKRRPDCDEQFQLFPARIGRPGDSVFGRTATQVQTRVSL